MQLLRKLRKQGGGWDPSYPKGRSLAVDWETRPRAFKPAKRQDGFELLQDMTEPSSVHPTSEAVL